MSASPHAKRCHAVSALLSISTGLFMAGCASAPDATHLARVEAAAPQQAAGVHGQQACTQLLTQALEPGEQLVLASYSFGGSPSLRVRQWVAAPSAAMLSPGDPVRLVPGACAVKASAKG